MKMNNHKNQNKDDYNNFMRQNKVSHIEYQNNNQTHTNF
jgi:hypothetical protein